MSERDAMAAARACLADPGWRTLARQKAEYVCLAMRLAGLRRDPAAQAFARTGEETPGLLPWVAAHVQEIYAMRFGFDDEFVRRLRAGTWPYMDLLAAGKFPAGVNSERPGVARAVAGAVEQWRAAQ